MAAPSIAKDYWRLPENATIKDVLYAVRSDETTHRFVNHSLGNLEPDDVNPFAIREPDMHVMGKTIEYVHHVCDVWSILNITGRFSGSIVIEQRST
jgi:ubiquinol oxidase